MSIDTGDFAVNCVNQGLFLGVNPHFLIAVAFSLSGIKDDTNGNRIGPFRVTQADWDAKLADPAFENSLTSADITNPIMQCSFATVQTLHAQDSLVQTLKRYPSADELYAQWPKSPALPGNSLQSALDNTRALILPAVQAALAGMDEGPVVGDVDLSSIAAGPRLDNAKTIVSAFKSAGYATAHQIAALANAIAESNLNAKAVFDTPSEHSVGLFQLNTKGGLGAGHTDAELLDPAKNTDIIIKKAKSIKEFKAAVNLHDAVAVFVRKIEQPANQAGEIIKRLAFAQPFVPKAGA
jgi:Phage tail lysozyme